MTDNCDLDSSSQQRRPGRHHGLLDEDNWLNCRADAVAPDKSSSWLFGAGKGWEAVWGHVGGAHKVWGGRRPARWSLGGGGLPAHANPNLLLRVREVEGARGEKNQREVEGATRPVGRLSGFFYLLFNLS